MALQQISTLVIFLAVFGLFATRVMHRAVAALVGALALAAWSSFPTILSWVFPDVLLVTAGLMVLTGFIKRSGLTAWLALATAKVTRGRPTRILVGTGVIIFVCAAMVGPTAAVLLVVPVTLLLAVELDVPTLPFVVTLSWTAVLGGATVLTAQPGNLWMATALGIGFPTWLFQIALLTMPALFATLVLSVLVFGKKLRVTNERRARVLEYDLGQSLEDRALVFKTLVVLGLVVLGIVAGFFLPLSPVLVVVGGAVLLLLWDGRPSVDKALAELDGGTLLFYTGLMIVVGSFGASGLPALWASWVPPHPIVLLWGSAFLGSFVDSSAVEGALVPLLQGWTKTGVLGIWPFIALGSSLGAGITVWGSASSAALNLAGSGRQTRKQTKFVLYALLIGVVNLAVISLVWLLVR